MNYLINLSKTLKNIKIAEVNASSLMIYSLVKETYNTFEFVGIPSEFNLFDCLNGCEDAKMTSGKIMKSDLDKEYITAIKDTKMGIGINGVFCVLSKKSLAEFAALLGIKGSYIYKKPSLNRDVYLASLCVDKKIFMVCLQGKRPFILSCRKDPDTVGPEYLKCALKQASESLGEETASYPVICPEKIGVKLLYGKAPLMAQFEAIDYLEGKDSLSIKLSLRYRDLELPYAEFFASDELFHNISEAIEKTRELEAFIGRLNSKSGIPDLELIKKVSEKFYEDISDLQKEMSVMEFIESVYIRTRDKNLTPKLCEAIVEVLKKM